MKHCKLPTICIGQCLCTATTVAPQECDPCRYCHRVADLYAEIPLCGDWDGRGFVMRIGCLCPPSLTDMDANRTEFEAYSVAVRMWNHMQATGGQYGDPKRLDQ